MSSVYPEENMKKAIAKKYDIEPSDYRFIATCVWYSETREGPNGEMLTSDPMPHVNYGFEGTFGWKENEVVAANSRNRCEHCNIRIVHHAAYEHIPTGELLAIGLTCASETFSHSSREELDLYRLKRLSEAHYHRTQTNRKVDEFKASYPELYDEMEAAEFGFFLSLYGSLNRYGSLTEKQLEAGLRIVAEKKAKAEAKAANPPSPAPTGRVDVTGRIENMKTQESMYGMTLKMRVTVDQGGWTLWVSVPKTLWDAEVGDRISLSVEVFPSQKDETFAIGKRPTRAQVIS